MLHHLESEDLVDIWQEMNPDVRGYTYSATHGSYSEFILFFVSRTLARLIKKGKNKKQKLFLFITWFDHAPAYVGSEDWDSMEKQRARH